MLMNTWHIISFRFIHNVTYTSKEYKIFALSSLTLMLLLALAAFAFAILGQKRQKDKKTKISLLLTRHRHHSYCCSLLLALTLFAITTDVYRELMANLLQSAFCLKAILFFESFLVTAAWIFKRLNLDVFIVVSSSGYYVYILFVILLAMSIWYKRIGFNCLLFRQKYRTSFRICRLFSTAPTPNDD